MNRMRSFVFGIAILTALCCAGVAQEVHTDHDKSANFERYHTYYWAKVQTSNPLWQQRIQDSVDKDLQAKGWQRSEGSGDVALPAVGSAHDRQEYQTFYNGLGGWRWGGFGPEATPTVENYKVGTLVLDMYDTQSKRLVWRGTATDTLSEKPESNEKKLDQSVDKLFEHFPPKK